MTRLARDFYPFVEEEGAASPQEDALGELPEVTHPARIAVYDDAAAAPRVVIVEPKDVRDYLEEITATVNRLSHEQGGQIPFMVIREIVENFIHAYFQAPTITILDGGNTIRFSDQGPGIREKALALEYGTSSATEGMRRYIRGVGSGLPYAQQYMENKGGSLTIEDNISGGTVVTLSVRCAEDANAVSRSQQAARPQTPAGAWATQPAPATYPQINGMQMPYQQAMYPQPAPQGYAAPWPQQATYPQPQGFQGQATTPTSGAVQTPATVSERGALILGYLAEHDSCGPTDLVREFGYSGPTWSRELAALVSAGYVMKAGQKHRLTAVGRAWC